MPAAGPVYCVRRSLTELLYVFAPVLPFLVTGLVLRPETKILSSGNAWCTQPKFHLFERTHKERWIYGQDTGGKHRQLRNCQWSVFDWPHCNVPLLQVCWCSVANPSKPKAVFWVGGMTRLEIPWRGCVVRRFCGKKKKNRIGNHRRLSSALVHSSASHFISECGTHQKLGVARRSQYDCQASPSILLRCIWKRRDVYRIRADCGSGFMRPLPHPTPPPACHPPPTIASQITSQDVTPVGKCIPPSDVSPPPMDSPPPHTHGCHPPLHGDGGSEVPWLFCGKIFRLRISLERLKLKKNDGGGTIGSCGCRCEHLVSWVLCDSRFKKN